MTADAAPDAGPGRAGEQARGGLSELLGLLDLEGVDTDLFRSRAAGVPGHRLFGGQVAAQRWSPPSAPPPAVPGAHSLHAYFLRPGDTGKPVVYQVDRLQDGRTFRRPSTATGP